jgi:hypothetical protein
MRLRMTASLVTVLCAWVLWEKWVLHHSETGSAPVIQAVYEAGTLLDCRKAMPAFIEDKAKGFKEAYKGPEHTVLSGPYAAILMRQRDNKELQEYHYYCLPSTVDPYHDPR